VFYKKSFLSLCLGTLLLPISAFAGSEDWQGVYFVKMQNGRIERVVHTKDYVQFMFMRSGKCSHFTEHKIQVGPSYPRNLKISN
jgi:hypothetical protein